MPVNISQNLKQTDFKSHDIKGQENNYDEQEHLLSYSSPEKTWEIHTFLTTLIVAQPCFAKKAPTNVPITSLTSPPPPQAALVFFTSKPSMFEKHHLEWGTSKQGEDAHDRLNWICDHKGPGSWQVKISLVPCLLLRYKISVIF